jgi:hypothetical protein
VPRKDRTFTDSDIVRLTIKNLSRREKEGVLSVLCGIEPGILVEPETPPLTKKTVDQVKIELEILTKTIGTMQTLIQAALLIPGPQQTILRTIDRSLSALLTILEAIARLLA